MKARVMTFVAHCTFMAVYIKVTSTQVVLVSESGGALLKIVDRGIGKVEN